MAGEFNIIEKYFSNRQVNRSDVLLAQGDDCALVQAPEGTAIAISTDTLVAGTHFLDSANPAWVAHKALASNISDLAAMGATPAWVSMAITLPSPDIKWIEPFCDSFFQLADYYGIQLIGGDTTKGPLSISLTVQGFVSPQNALKRSEARLGDWIYVTGDLGLAKAGLDIILDPSLKAEKYASFFEESHYLSSPRVVAGQALIGIASSCIDISDGLVADLGHILTRSSVGANLDVSLLPLNKKLIEYCGTREKAEQFALSSGEEYELCFTIPEMNKGSVETELAHIGTSATCIGQIVAGNDLTLTRNGQAIELDVSGFDHFSA